MGSMQIGAHYIPLVVDLSDLGLPSKLLKPQCNKTLYMTLTWVGFTSSDSFQTGGVTLKTVDSLLSGDIEETSNLVSGRSDNPG